MDVGDAGVLIEGCQMREGADKGSARRGEGLRLTQRCSGRLTVGHNLADARTCPPVKRR